MNQYMYLLQLQHRLLSLSKISIIMYTRYIMQNMNHKLNSVYKGLEHQTYILKLTWYVDELLELLKIIDRSISLSWKEILNL